jgi:hypothetical protein
MELLAREKLDKIKKMICKKEPSCIKNDAIATKCTSWILTYADTNP